MKHGWMMEILEGLAPASLKIPTVLHGFGFSVTTHSLNMRSSMQENMPRRTANSITTTSTNTYQAKPLLSTTWQWN